MSFDRFSNMSETHARAEVERTSERARLRGQRRTFVDDVHNLARLLPRLVRRVRRSLRR